MALNCSQASGSTTTLNFGLVAHCRRCSGPGFVPVYSSLMDEGLAMLVL